MNEKPNCYKCQYRGDLPGDAHSCCHHPANGPINDDPFLSILAIFGSVGRGPGVNVSGEGLHVRGNPHGIRHSWFNFPLNFDPVWLEECDGFKAKEEPHADAKNA